MHYEQLSRELIRALRGKRSQTAFSRRLGYRSNVVYAWESGARRPTGSEMLRAAELAGVEVRAALRRFYPTTVFAERGADPCTPEGAARFLDELRGNAAINDLADRTGLSRFRVSRWLSGRTEPKLPEFLALVHACSLRLPDFLAELVDPEELPSIADQWRRLNEHRRLARDSPWIQVLLLALTLDDYQSLTEHRSAWLAERIGVTVHEIDQGLGLLADAGRIHWKDGRWAIRESFHVDTRPDPAAGRSLRIWAAEQGLQRIREGADGKYSFNIFTVSADGLEKLREAHSAYFRELRAIIAEGTSSDHLMVANIQLFPLDPTPAPPTDAEE